MSDTLLTVRDVAAVLQCSGDAVVRRFAKLPGVIDLGKPETRSRRRYRVLRIPKSVVEKYLSAKSGQPVQITVPEKPERRRRSPAWEDRAILNLAKAGLQNDVKDRNAYRRLADRACALANIPEKVWPDLIEAGWVDEDADED